MEPAVRDALTTEVRRIGDRILGRGEHDGRGLSWTSVSIRKDGTPHRSRVAHLWSGSAGVGLFLLELHARVRDRRYLAGAIEAVRWAEARCLDRDPPGLELYTGALGVALVLLRLAERTGNETHLRRARRLIEHGEPALDRSDARCDVMTGLAGTLLGLLHLHAATRDDHLLRLIARCEARLLESARHGREGIYWDRSPRFVSGLCGLAHGAGGIGFVLLEAARRLGRPGLVAVAEHAFAYEDQFFVPARDNWADLRRGVGSRARQEARLEAVRHGDDEYFVRPTTSAPVWCHGAAGIGLARLHAYAELGRSDHLEAARRAIAGCARYVERHRSADVARTSFSLCHGLGGPGELFLEAGLELDEPADLRRAARVAELALRHRSRHGGYVPGTAVDGRSYEDDSLFVGNAGVGYLFLRLLDPGRTPSVLLPRVGTWAPTRIADRAARPVRAPTGSPSVPPVVTCLRALYPRTSAVVGELAPERLRRAAESLEAGRAGDTSFRPVFERIVRSVADAARRGVAVRLRDLFGLEWARIALDLASRSHALLDAKRTIAARRAAALLDRDDDAAWMDVPLCFGEHARIIGTRWRWHGDGRTRWYENLDRGPAPGSVLLLGTPEGVAERELTRFEAVLLSRFATPSSAAAVAVELSDAIDGEEPNRVRHLVVEQTREMLRAGLLRDARLFQPADGAGPEPGSGPGRAEAVGAEPKPLDDR